MDVVIIGAGPAGITAAISLGAEGLKVTLIGGVGQILPEVQEPLQSVHPGLESLLARLNAQQAVGFSSRATYTGIWVDGNFNSLNPDGTASWYGHHLHKSSFNHYLLFISRQYDISFVENDPVISFQRTGTGYAIRLRSGQMISCRYVIDASGKHRFMGKMLRIGEAYYSEQLTAWSGLSYAIREDFFEHVGTSFIPEHDGWTWLAPQSPGRCTWTRLSLTASKLMDCPGVLKEFPYYKKLVSSNMRWRLFKRVAFEGVLLTGDAAGIIDPAAGQGIFTACLSAIEAARILILIMNGTTTEASGFRAYQEWYTEFYLSKVDQLKSYYQRHGLNIV